MTVSIDQLVALSSAFSAIRIGPETVGPGVPVEFQLLRPAQLPELTDIISVPLDISWIVKDVRFADAKPLAALDPASLTQAILGGMPEHVPIKGGTPVGGLTPILDPTGNKILTGGLLDPAAVADVPGLLAQLAGNLPIPVNVPVEFSVSWGVYDEQGQLLNPGPTTFSAPDGMVSPIARFIFSTAVVELTSTTIVSTVTRYVQAEVTLTAGGTSQTVKLPPLPVIVPQIGIPTLLVMFMHENFQTTDDPSAALVIVPANSPLRTIEQLMPLLNALQTTASNLGQLVEFTSLLLGLNELTGGLGAQERIQFFVGDEIKNLNDITLFPHRWWPPRLGIEAEDEMSSIIFLGVPGKTVRCYNDRDFDQNEGWFELTVGFHSRSKGLVVGPEMITLVRSLHSAKPVSEPTRKELRVPIEPGGYRTAHDITSFGDELSSLHFTADLK